MWQKQTPLKQHGFGFLALLLVSVTFFAPIHFSGKQLIAGDTVSWRGMAQSMIEYEEQTGEVALWAGRTFAGMPGYMISPELTVPQVDSVMRQLRLLFWPTSHMMLLFMGMYFLAWFLTRDTLASIMGAVAYGFTTYIPVILVAGHNSKFIALAWAPWMLLAFAYAMKQRNVLSALLFAVALAVNLRAGHVQITYYVTVAAGIWWLFEGVKSIRTAEVGQFLKSTGMLALGSVLGLMMVAEPYLAHAELAPFTTRGSASGGAPGGMAWEYAMAWSQGIAELWTLVVSDIFGGASPTYWGAKTFTGGPHHLGIIVIVFAALAVWRKRDLVTWSLVTAIVVMTMFSLGQNLSVLNKPMFDYFPMFDAFRVPETWLSVVALLVAVLASRGILELKNGISITRFTSVPHVRGFMLGSVLILAMMTVGPSFLSFEKPFEQDRLYSQIKAQYPSATDAQITGAISQEVATRMIEREDRFRADTRRAIFFLLLVMGLLWLYHRKMIPYWMTAIGIIVLLAFDLGGVGRRYMNENALSDEIEVADKVPEYEFDTFLKARAFEEGGEGGFRVLSLEFGQNPETNARPSFHYESLGGYSGAKLRVYQDFLDQLIFLPSGTGINQPVLDMLNVRFVVAGGAVPGYIPVFQDEQTGMIVLASETANERAFLVDRVTRLADAPSVWDRLREPDFDPSKEALMVGVDAELVERVRAATDSTTVKRVNRIAYTAQEMTFQVESDHARLLVVSEIYYKPGWKAFVNGEETPIFQTNYVLRGVEVPAGVSEVQLVFEPASFRNGRMITGAGTLIVYGWLLVFGLQAVRRKEQDEDPEYS